MIVIDGDDGDVTSTGNTGGKAYLYLRTAVIMIDCGRILIKHDATNEVQSHKGPEAEAKPSKPKAGGVGGGEAPSTHCECRI